MGSSNASVSEDVPATLAGVQVQVKDAGGTTRNAALFYVSPTQISYQNPPGTTLGAAKITVMLNGMSSGRARLWWSR